MLFLIELQSECFFTFKHQFFNIIYLCTNIIFMLNYRFNRKQKHEICLYIFESETGVRLLALWRHAWGLALHSEVVAQVDFSHPLVGQYVFSGAGGYNMTFTDNIGFLADIKRFANIMIGN